MSSVGGTVAPKKKINRADYMFNQLKDQTVIKKPGDVDGI
jgi:hypothetical protein